MKQQKLTALFTSLLLLTFLSTAVLPLTGQNNPEKAQLEKQMALAFEIWYQQQPEMKQIAIQAGNNLQQIQGKNESIIKGVIKDDQGSVLKAVVFYWTNDFSNQAMSGTVATDNSGHYEIAGLSSGIYLLAAVANGYLTEFYNDTQDITQIDPITLAESDTVEANFSLSLSNQGGGSISGTVKTEGSLVAIENAWIMAARAENPFNIYFASSDQNGAFQLVGLPSGIYVLYAQASGYVSEFYDGAYTLMQAKPVPVQRAAVTGINFTLIKGGSIAGKVKDSKDIAIRGVKVTALPHGKNDFANIPFFNLRWQIATSNDRGEYKIDGLKDGEYIISAAIHPDHGAPLVMYYNNTYDWEQATPVKIANGQDVTGIDFKFENTEPTGIISGKVTDVAGNPLADIGISVWASRDSVFYGHFGRWNYAKTDEKGLYKIENLWPGEYIVSATRWEWWDFQTIYYDGVEKPEDATPVKVQNNAETQNINFVFEKGRELGAISGTVLSETDKAAISYAIVQAIPVDPMIHFPNIRPVPAMITFSDASGKYLLEKLVEGKYYISVIKNGYEEFYDNKKDLDSADPVEVLGGETQADINFLIPPIPATGSRISGKVTDEATGKAITGAFVGVYTKFSSGNPWGKLDYFMTATDANGEYIIGGIPQGEYIASSWARDYIAEFYKNTLNPLAAEVIKLDGKEQKTGIDFSLTPGQFFNFVEKGSEGRGSVSGKVVNQQGQQVSAAYVYAYDENNQVVASEITSSDGSYVISGLISGAYTLEVTRVPYEIKSTDAPVTIGDKGQWDVTDVNFALTPMPTAVTDENMIGVPGEFGLDQNYPNPFNPNTTICYTLARATRVKLEVLNLQGQVVRTLVTGVQPASSHQVTWDATNDLGQKVASGIYLYRLEAEGFSRTMRLVLLK